MSKPQIQKIWKDPQPHFKMTFKEVKRKSRGGVEYTNLVPTLEKVLGSVPPTDNRERRHKQAAYERSLAYRINVKRLEKKHEKAH